MDLCAIEYMARSDAADMGLPSNSIDFHTSCTVLEHVPPSVLLDILKEGNRLIRDSGLFVHLVDYTDHFSHADPRISSVNFLRYSDAQWKWYAGNRYMYMNRLRHDDFIELFHRASHRILAAETHVDPRAKALLESGFEVHRRFGGKSLQILSVASSWIVSTPN